MPSNSRKLKRLGLGAEKAFQLLIEAILNGKFNGGDTLREVRLARQWKVGRTPLREAMRRAAESGFVVLRTNRAPIVRILSMEDINNLYELRELLELYAFDMAWKHLTSENISGLEELARQSVPFSSKGWQKQCLRFDAAMHELWTSLCGNKWLADDLHRHYRLVRVFIGWSGRNEELLVAAYHEHLQIFNAIKSQNKQLTGELLRSHIRHAAELVKQTLSESTKHS